MAAENPAPDQCQRRQWLILLCLFLVVTILVYQLDIDSIDGFDTPAAGSVGQGRTVAAQISSTWVTAPPWSLDIIRQHVASKDFFPGEGNWTGLEEGNEDKERFVPHLCSFQHGVSLPGTYLTKCLKNKNIRNVLILGDSNGHRYYEAFLRMFTKENLYRCRTLKKEAGDTASPDKSFFTKGTDLERSEIKSKRRGCHTCRSATSNCTRPGSSSSVVDFIAMEHIIDSEVVIDKKSCPSDGACVGSTSTQEFLFKRYLPSTVGYYPDIIIVIVNTHDVNKSRSVIEDNVKQLCDVMRDSVPATSRIIWIPVHGKFKNNKLVAWEGRRMYSEAWFEVLKPLVSDVDSNMAAFFDLQVISKDVLLRGWMPDGKHFINQWYDMISAYIMQAVCNE